MERKYSKALLDGMREKQRETTFEGVPVLVKPIPEGGEPGDMDPRLYRTMRMMPLLEKLMVFRKKPKTILETVLPLRKMFGEYKGIRLVDAGVQIARETVPSADGYPVPVRVYTRLTPGSGRPVLVFFHGGGFFGGGVEIVEQLCMLLVQKLDCVVCSVAYRLCPENHYPQPLDDCWNAALWARENAVRFGGDGARLAVGGDSAGGNLAAAITLRSRREGIALVKCQLLLYPVVNIAGKKTGFYQGVQPEKYCYSHRHAKILRASQRLISKMLNGGGSENLMEEIYLQGRLPAGHEYASPLLGDCTGLPPTLLLFGEHDFLAFEDFAYAQTLQKAGVPLRLIVYRGLGHGFADQIGVTPQAEDCVDELTAYLAGRLGG